jgi:hypothetical protein
VSVRHRGDALEVEVEDGLRAGVVYRVTVQPVVRDLFGNGMREPFEFVFSTGGALSPSTIAGLVVDRITGRPARDVLVQAVPADTSEAPVIHVARTDTGGFYGLRYLTPGRYDLVGFLDRNRSRTPDPYEAVGGREEQLSADDTVFANFALLEPDTTGPRLTRAEVPDRSLVRLTFDDYVDPAVSLASTGVTLERIDRQAGAPEVSQLVHEHRYVALRREERARRDSVAARPDSAAARPDSAAAGVQLPPRSLPTEFVGRAQGADSTYLSMLELILPSRVVYAELADSLHFGVDYVLRIQGMVNLSGAPAATDTIRVSRGAAPASPPAARPPGPGRR